MRFKDMKIANKFMLMSSFLVLFSVCATAAIALLEFRNDLLRQADQAQDSRLRTFWELLRHKGVEFRIDNNNLMVGDYVVNGNFELPDKVQQLFGGTATIFMNDTRVTTNVLKPDGSRAVGTRLTGPAYEAVFKHGQSYRGQADILGIPYFTAYDPIKNARGETIGVLYVGIKQSDYFATFDRLLIGTCILAALLVAVLNVLVYLFVRRQLKPLNYAVSVANQVSAGNLAVALDGDRKDETGQLLSALKIMVQKLQSISGEINGLTEAAREGNLDVRADASRHDGDFGKIVDGINRTLDALIEPLQLSAGHMDQISKGILPRKDLRRLQRRFQRHEEQPEHDDRKSDDVRRRHQERCGQRGDREPAAVGRLRTGVPGHDGTGGLGGRSLGFHRADERHHQTECGQRPADREDRTPVRRRTRRRAALQWRKRSLP